MRVIMVCGFALSPKATVSARAVPMARALKERGHDATVLVSPYDNMDFSGRSMLEEGVPIENLAIRGRSIYKYLKIPLDFLREIRRRNPDVIHIFKPKGFSGLTAMLLHLMRRPFVLDHDDWEGWGGWNETAPHSRPVKHFINFQERWIPRKAQAITVASRLLERRLLQARVPAERVFYAPNGPRPSLADWRASDRAEVEALKSKLGSQGKVVIWYAGHMDEADYPMAALKTLVEIVTSKGDAVAWIAGPPKTSLQGFVRQSGAAGSISFLGWLAYEDYLRYLAASDIAFYPFPDTPVYRAKCSGKIVQYMALGKPVVTTPVGQNLEYIENGKSGILARDCVEMASALTSLVDDATLRQRLGQNAQRRIWGEFSWEKTVDRVLQAYALALSRTRCISRLGVK